MFNDYQKLTLSNLFDKQLKRFPDHVVQIFEDGNQQTYSQLNDRANRLANGLLNLGIRRGDFVAFYAMNCLEYMEFHLATARIGVVSVLLNCFMSRERIAYMLELSTPKAIIFDDQYQDIVSYCQNKLPWVKHYIMINRKDKIINKTEITYESLIEQSVNQKPNIGVKLTDPNTLYFTTGTTGNPKGILKSQAADLWHGLSNNFFSYYPYGSILQASPYHYLRHIVVPPLFHIGPQAYHLFCFMFPRSAVIMRKFDPEKFLWLIDKKKIHGAWVQPAMLWKIKELPPKSLVKYDRSSVFAVICGGSSVSNEDLDAISEFFPNANLTSNYASTETGSVAFVTKEEMQKTNPKNIGMPALGAALKVVNKDGDEANTGEIGQIWITCPGMPINCEYYKDPSKTEKSFKEGWVCVGDMGYQDEQGYTYYFARGDDLISSGGEKVSPLQVKEVLLQIEGVQAAEVIGVRDRKWGEAVKALIIKSKKSDISEKEVISFCKQRLAKYEVPKSVEFVDEFPIGSTGKVSQKDLKERYGR